MLDNDHLLAREERGLPGRYRAKTSRILKRYRQNRRFSIEQCATAVNVQPRTWASWEDEKDHRMFSIDKVPFICFFLNISAEALLLPEPDPSIRFLRHQINVMTPPQREALVQFWNVMSS